MQTDVFKDSDPPRNMTVDEWCAIDRQWFRSQRIAHARYQRKEAQQAKDTPAVRFWNAVLHRNKREHEL